MKLRIKKLNIGFAKKNNVTVVKDIDFDVRKGSITALLGNSGSGKTLISLAIMGLTNHLNNCKVNGQIILNKEGENINLSECSSKDFEKLRGSEIAMLFQDPLSSFNPNKTCKKQVFEVLKQKEKSDDISIEGKIEPLLEKVGLDKKKLDKYPHQLSGGELQRIHLLTILALKPKFLIADEPTTNLDYFIKKQILDLLLKIKEETGMTILYISHDLEAVKYVADDIVLIEKGIVVEKASKQSFFSSPQSDFAKNLLKSSDLSEIAHSKLESKQGNALLKVKNLSHTYKKYSIFNFKSKASDIKALDNVNFELQKGEILGIIGQSGSGKSTIARIITGFVEQDSGSISFMGESIDYSGNKAKRLRKNIQIVFQNPFSSLNPVISVKKLLEEPFTSFKLYKDKADLKKKINTTIKAVGLESSILNKYPHQLSGGESQRVAIARALSVDPKLIIFDESISSLDKMAQIQILEMLLKLRKERQLSYMFITHDLKVSEHFCDRELVLKHGKANIKKK